MRNKPVQNHAGKECAEDSFQSYGFAQCGAHKEYGHHEDELHDRVGVAAQEPSCEPWYEVEHGRAVETELDGKP